MEEKILFKDAIPLYVEVNDKLKELNPSDIEVRTMFYYILGFCNREEKALEAYSSAIKHIKRMREIEE